MAAPGEEEMTEEKFDGIMDDIRDEYDDTDEVLKQLEEAVAVDFEDKSPARSSVSLAAVEAATLKLEAQLDALAALNLSDCSDLESDRGSDSSWVPVEDHQESVRVASMELKAAQFRAAEQHRQYTEHLAVLRQALDAQKSILARQTAEINDLKREKTRDKKQKPGECCFN
jgi:hypothetical protein